MNKILSPEGVGTSFSLAEMERSRQNSIEAVKRISSSIAPGMSTREATELARDILAKMNMQRVWHPIIIRFGADTLKTFKEPGDPNRILGENDIYFIDIGPVWNGHEGDAGDTFVVGGDPEMLACAQAARTLWQEVNQRWRDTGLSGQALYNFAQETAETMGWRLNLDIKGHRLSDFPHAIYKAGRLGDFGLCPATGLWVLEIQIAHRSRKFGAFYEDLLISDSD